MNRSLALRRLFLVVAFLKTLIFYALPLYLATTLQPYTLVRVQTHTRALITTGTFSLAITGPRTVPAPSYFFFPDEKIAEADNGPFKSDF